MGSFACSLQLVGKTMIRFAEILCPVDRSDVSRRALTYAQALAGWYDATLTVVEVTWSGSVPPVLPAAAAEAVGSVPGVDRQALLTELRQFCGMDGDPGLRLHLAIREGAVVPHILEEAQTRGTDLIVMGTHGYTGLNRILLGSVAEKTLHAASCPVLTVPPAAADRPDDPSRPFRRIVCAMDFSPASFAALNHALSLAQEAEASLTLVHVTAARDETRPGPDRGVELAADRRLLHSAATRELRLAVPDDARHWCQCQEVVRTGRPASAIIDVVRETDADLVVLGVHGHARLTKPFIGSTADAVVRHAPCPVLTVR